MSVSAALCSHGVCLLRKYLGLQPSLQFCLAGPLLCKAVPGTVTGQAARGEAALTLPFQEGRGKERKQAPPLSGRSNKVLSTAVRMTQGDLPDSISSTLFSVPKPNSWHVKTLLPMPASAQVSGGVDSARYWAPLSRSLETFLCWQQNALEIIICSH